MPPPIRAGIYARVSSRQQRDNTSIETQVADCRQHAASRGWVVASEYVDAAESGRKVTRPALQRLLADVSAGKLDAVIVWKLDRLGRNTWQQLGIIEQHFQGVQFESVTESVDRLTAGGKFSLAVMVAAAELQSNLTSERVRRARKHQVLRGEWVGPPPFGYERGADKRLHPSADAPTVVLLFEWYASGQYGYDRLAKALNQQGAVMLHPTTHARFLFTASTIQCLIANPIYADPAHAPLVDLATWERCQAIRASRSRRGGTTRTYAPILLGALARCGACDAVLWQASNTVTTGGRQYRYTGYRCSGRARHTCDARIQRSTAVERAVAQQIIGRLRADAGLFDEARTFLDTAPPAPVVDVTALVSQRDRLTEAYILGRLPKAAYDTRYATLEATITAATTVPDPVDHADAAAFLMDLPDLYRAATPDERHELMEIIIDTAWLRDEWIVGLRPHAVYADLFAAALCVGKTRPSLSLPLAQLPPSFPPLWTAYNVPYRPAYAR